MKEKNETLSLNKYFIFLIIIISFYSSIFAADRPIIPLNPEKFNLPKDPPIKSEINKPDEMKLPEGGRVIKGMNIPLIIKEINVYGFDIYKKKSVGKKNIEKNLEKAISIHNEISKGKKVKIIPEVKENSESYKIIFKGEKEVYLSLVYALAQQLTKQYQGDKYFLSRAIVPAQKIDEKKGVIDICVIEGYLPKEPVPDIVSDDKKLNKVRERIKNSLGNNILGQKNKPLSFDSFEEEILLIRDMPGVDIKTTFQQVTQKKANTNNCKEAFSNGMGETSLLVSLNVKKYNGSVNMDNYGIKSAGPEFLRADFNANSIFQAGDQYTLDTAVSLDGKELKNYGFTAKIPLHGNGLKLNASHRIGDATPGEEFSELAIRNKTKTSEIGLEYPLIRSRKENLTISGKIKYQDIETDLLNASFVRDSIRTLHSQLIYDRADTSGDFLENGINIISLEAIRGLNSDGATQKSSVLASRTEADPTFTRFVIEAKRFKNLPSWRTDEGFFSKGNFKWINSIKLQHTSQPLFASEEFELGGRGYGRGFDIGVISGDKGLGFSTQIDYNFSDAAGNWTLFNFLDYGKISNVDTTDQGTDQESVELSSTGVGVNFQHNKQWYINTEFSQPLTISGNRDKKGHVYIGIGYNF